MKFILLASILFCSATHAQVFKCEGADGKTFYSQSACPEAGRQMQPRELAGHVGSSITGDAPAQAADERREPAAPKKAPSTTQAATRAASASSRPATPTAAPTVVQAPAAPTPATPGRIAAPGDADRITRHMRDEGTIALGNCDPNGCWDNSGRRFVRNGTVLLSPEGQSCAEVGGGRYACR